MTTLVAMRDGDDVVIGSDTASHRGQRRVGSTIKWAIGDGCAVGFAGTLLHMQLIFELATEVLADRPDPLELRRRITKALTDGGVTPHEAKDAVHSADFEDDLLYVRPPEIWDFDGEMGAAHVDLYGVAGSGCEFALGALVGAQTADKNAGRSRAGDDYVRLALETACRFDIYSAGQLFIQRIKPAMGVA